jgi:hypothetical protein
MIGSVAAAVPLVEISAGVRITGGTRQFGNGAQPGPPSRAPVLVSRRIPRTSDGWPVEQVTLCYRANRYRFQVEPLRP